jgi:hypothetical protein
MIDWCASLNKSLPLIIVNGDLSITPDVRIDNREKLNLALDLTDRAMNETAGSEVELPVILF